VALLAWNVLRGIIDEEVKDGSENRETVAELLCSALSLFVQMATQKYMRTMKILQQTIAITGSHQWQE
jgi:hypothetical protein